ncbi:MAG: fibronectin type III domain-containing protein, partial [Planctomycetota bacterium]
FKYVRGNGSGGAPNVGAFDDPAPGGFGNFWDRLLPGGTRYAGSYIGTPNDNSDIDTGWSVEVFMSWADIGLASKPVHGQTIGMNFDVIFDQDGGERNLVNNRLGEDRFTLPEFIDDHIQGTFSSYIGAQSGIQGPVNYAKAMFIDARAGQTPATVNDLTANDPTPFSARLEFTAPTGTTSGLGHVSGYAVRYSTSPIAGEATWQDATVYENRIVPRLAGSDEVVRLMGLDPNTTYHVAIRAIDGAGNYGAISNGASFTTGTAVPGDNGTLRVSPNGRFFQFEDGSEFVSVGDHFSIAGAFTRSLYTGTVWDAANGVFRNFSEGTPLEGPSEPFFESLRDAGVNTMRVFLEIPGSHTTGNPSTPDGTYWLEHNAGQFNPAMREFVDNILEVSAEYGFYLIFSPFYTYTFDDAFDTEGPWKTDFGGPLTSIDDFYQNPATLDIAKNRMTEVLGWVNDSPHKNHVMGWEPMNEWEASGWTQNAEGDGFPAREPEMRRRAAFVIELSKHIKEVDPDANVLLASVTRSPRGPVARAMFYDRTADALVPHIYTNANAEPMNSPFADRSVLAAIEQAHYTAYYLTSDEGRRHLLNGEWGVDPIAWEGEPAVFGPNYTEAENDLIFRTVVWSGFASGQFGTALRVPSSEMRAYGFISSPGMRDMQERFGEFVTSTSLDIDWSRFDPMPMAGRISLDAGNKVVHAFGVGDGETGVVYLLQDGIVSTGNVTGTITIAGLRADALFDIEVWATDPNQTGLRSTISGVYSADGTVTFTLPAFSEDIAIKLKARPTADAAQKAVAVSNNGLLINFFIGADGQPLARVINAATGEQTIQDIASIGGFRGVARDLTAFTTTPTQAFTTREGPVHLAVTDTENNVWLFSGKPLLGEWTATNLTKDINAPGLSGDLTFYLPTWGSLTIAGLDARGHAVAYWYNVGRAEWNHFDYTAAADGPKLSGGLTGFVTSWDALNLVGLSESGEVIAYWWVPGRSWDFLSMTSAVAGPALSGQLTAFTTSWNAMNIVGMNDTGDLVAYWWSPARTGQGWTFTNLSQQVGA